jgi:hypothetical protein
MKPVCLASLQGALNRQAAPQRHYEHLKYCGRAHGVGNVPATSKPTRIPTVLKRILPQMWDHLSAKAGEFYANNPDRPRVLLSEMKLDVPFVHTPRKAEYRLALEIVDEMLEAALTHSILTHEETLNLILQMKGPGYPWRYFGYKTRAELLNDPAFMEVLQGFPECFWTITPKRELEKLEVIIGEKKIRTFIIPPLQLLYWQLRYYHPGNENLKNLWWSKYGFNPFGGGVSRMAKRLLSKPYRYYIDVKGYDRKVWLARVMDRRNRFLIGGEDARKKWLYDNTVTSYIIMSNRDVVFKMAGNNSGSGMTTTNNIEVGMEMHAYSLICAYVDKNGELPDKDAVKEQELNLYGDDHAGAVDEEFSYVTIESKLRAYFADFGLELKEFGGGFEYPLSDLMFLGFRFTEIGKGHWGPVWNESRLVTVLAYDIDRNNVSKYLSRFYSIMMLCFYNPIWNSLRAMYIELLREIQFSSCQTLILERRDPCVAAFIRRGAPSFSQMVAFYTGLESSGGEFLSAELAHIFSPLEVEGPKKILQSMNTTNVNTENRPETKLVDCEAGLAEGWDSAASEIQRVKCPGFKLSQSENFKGALLEFLVKTSRTAELLNVTALQNLSKANYWSVTLSVGSCESNVIYCGQARSKVCAEQVAYRLAWLELTSAAAVINDDDIRGHVPLARFLREIVAEDYSLLDRFPGLLRYVFLDDLASAARIAADLKVGSFNPYGNGQGLSKTQFLAKNKVKWDKQNLTSAQRNARWLTYNNSQVSAAKKPLPKIPRKRLPQKPMMNMLDQPSRRQEISQIGSRSPFTGGRRNRPANQMRGGVMMSRCASLYAVGVINPFSFLDGTLTAANERMGIKVAEDELPCIPTFPVMKTRRHKAFIRGVFNTFTDGTGYMVLAPNRISNANPLTNNYWPPLIYSNGTATSPGFGVFDTGLLVSATDNAQSFNTDYGFPVLGSTQTRVVGAGIRVRYTGTELNRGGTLHCVEQPTHLTLSGLTIANVSQLESYFREPITRNWTTLVYTPVQEQEINFNSDPTNTSVLTNFTHAIGFIFAAAAVGVSQQFEFECICLYEAVGPLIRDLRLSECDPVGLSMVQNVIRPETQLVVNESGPGKVFDMIRSGFDMVTTVAPYVARAASLLI